ncbi:hypothetical protein RHSIM_Rhsim04G0108900 [Rhododendron simsii]|uniref:GAG-pre-integrase domain-containing protein n=1 Tax=Rhododendron simsii TaxID=118357 RepID=A0A834HE03_RHOSS|nr:hypothetical protein RHSIM_Rhsim04G0108900 [Rhododendron simsii]
MASSASSASSSSLSTKTLPLSLPSPSFSNPHHFLSIKLTTTNYLYWRTQVAPFLRGQKLMGFVDGTNTCPPSHLAAVGDSPPQPNPEYDTWLCQDQMLMSMLIGSLSDDVFPLVVGLTTSQEIWTTLEASLASPSNTRILQLQNMRQGDKSVSSFLHRAKALSDELAAAGRPVSTADFNIYVFRGLRSDFKDLVTNMAARHDDISFSELHALLLSHEFLNAESFTTDVALPAPIDPPPTANFVQRSGSSSTQQCHSNNRNRGVSHSGNSSYYSSGGSYSGGRSRARGRGGRSQDSHSFHGDIRSRCQICNGTSHLASTCNQRYNHAHQSPSAHLAAFSNNGMPHHYDWFPDTGATHHVTPDLSTITHSEPYQGVDQLRVGNGKGLSISNVGTSFLSSPHSTFKLSNVLHVTQKTLLSGLNKDDLYQFTPPSVTSSPPSVFAVDRVSLDCWHRRLGHPHREALRQVLLQNKVSSSFSRFHSICSACQLGKSSRLPLRAMMIATESPTPQPQPTGNLPMAAFILKGCIKKGMFYFRYWSKTGQASLDHMSAGHNARRDARKRRTRSRACSSAKNAAPCACAYPQEPTATSSFALATITGRPREEDPNALELPFILFNILKVSRPTLVFLSNWNGFRVLVACLAKAQGLGRLAVFDLAAVRGVDRDQLRPRAVAGVWLWAGEEEIGWEELVLESGHENLATALASQGLGIRKYCLVVHTSFGDGEN